MGRISVRKFALACNMGHGLHRKLHRRPSNIQGPGESNRRRQIRLAERVVHRRSGIASSRLCQSRYKFEGRILYCNSRTWQSFIERRRNALHILVQRLPVNDRWKSRRYRSISRGDQNLRESNEYHDGFHFGRWMDKQRLPLQLQVDNLFDRYHVASGR